MIIFYLFAVSIVVFLWTLNFERNRSNEKSERLNRDISFHKNEVAMCNRSIFDLASENSRLKVILKQREDQMAKAKKTKKAKSKK